VKNIILILALVCLTVASGTGAAFAQSAAAGVTVQVNRVEFPVKLPDNNVYTLVAYLYTPQGADPATCEERRDTVQVLVHGATYDHRYWDVDPINGTTYSYARYMVQQCYSVLALDRLGAGESSRPDGDLLTKSADASSIAQILTGLRKPGNPTGRKFKRIVVVGHSFGTFTATYTLGTYGNLADAFVATAWVNGPGTIPVPADYIQSLLAAPYIMLATPVRTQLFYAPPSADQAVIDHDNANLATTFTRGFLLDAVALFTARAYGDIGQIKALTNVDKIGVPVFVQLGDNDILFSSALAGGEASLYSDAPSVTIDTLTNIGHAFNLHTTNQAGWQHIAAWIGRTVGN